MQTRQTIPDSPRLSYATETAYKWLIELGIDSFPISPLDVIDKLPQMILCLSYSKAVAMGYADDPCNIKKKAADARSLKLRGINQYLIIYDDSKDKPKRRLTFTLAHEIGHILLGHLDDFEETALNRGGLTNKMYRVLEKEADCFASEFLCPSVLLAKLPYDPDYIYLLFGISEAAAERKFSETMGKSFTRYKQYEEPLLRNFYRFFAEDLEDTLFKNIYASGNMPFNYELAGYCRKCHWCSNYITDRKATHCDYCGEEIYSLGELRSMASRVKLGRYIRIPGKTHRKLHNRVRYKTEVIDRMQLCFKCFNPISADEECCSVCGAPAVNRCMNDNRYLDFGQRYCPSCGADGTFGRYYTEYENIQDGLDGIAPPSDEWAEYPYLDYLANYIRRKNKNSAGRSLYLALMYSRAFIDDDNNILIYTSSQKLKDIIESNTDTLIDCLTLTDQIPHSKVDIKIADSHAPP